jgi:glucokinase
MEAGQRTPLLMPASNTSMGNGYLGIEIGGSKLQMVAGTGSGAIDIRRRIVVDRHAGAAGIRSQIEATLPQLLRESQPSGIGVGFGGPVDWRTGRICRSHQIAGWSEFDLAGWLSGRSGVPVVVENDANLAALGEAACGAGVGFDPALYVTLGSGVGGGLVVNGRIYHGAPPGEAEIGHVRLDRQGTIVEKRCSGWAVDEKIRALKGSAPGSLLCELTRGQPEGGEARFLSQALAAGDQAAVRILRETATDLAFALSHAVHLFHPAVIVLGGGLSLTGEPLRVAVAEALPAFLMEVFGKGPEIRLAALCEDAVPAGALLLAAASVQTQTAKPGLRQV